MARVTVEDCIDKVENRFDLVLIASHRARMISAGQAITVDRDNDKNPVVALREIAETMLQPDDLKEDLIHSLQKNVEVDEPEAETAPALSSAAAVVTPSDASADVQFDRMTEDDLLRGLDGCFHGADEPGIPIWNHHVWASDDELDGCRRSHQIGRAHV